MQLQLVKNEVPTVSNFQSRFEIIKNKENKHYYMIWHNPIGDINLTAADKDLFFIHYVGKNLDYLPLTITVGMFREQDNGVFHDIELNLNNPFLYNISNYLTDQFLNLNDDFLIGEFIDELSTNLEKNYDQQ